MYRGVSSREGRGGVSEERALWGNGISRAENGRRQDSDWTGPAPKTETRKCGGKKKMTRNAELLARESCDYFILLPIILLVIKCSEILT